MEFLPGRFIFQILKQDVIGLNLCRHGEKRRGACGDQGAKGARQLLYCFASLHPPCRPIKNITSPESVGSQTTSSVAARLVGECVLNVAHR